MENIKANNEWFETTTAAEVAAASALSQADQRGCYTAEASTSLLGSCYILNIEHTSKASVSTA